MLPMMTVRMIGSKRLYGVEVKPGDLVTVPMSIARELQHAGKARHLLSRHCRLREDARHVKVYDFTGHAVDLRPGAAMAALRRGLAEGLEEAPDGCRNNTSIK